jgi:FAD/FMN-containing dehydrogenase
VTLGALQNHAREAGFDAALDLGARDSATIGGVVACDAGGARALRYGTARRRVAGLEAVLADGSVIRRLDGLAKDNAGYDVPSLLVGSEGTLAVITEVVWRLETPLRRAVAGFVPLADAHGASRLLSALRTAAPSLDACELITRAALKLVLAHQRRTSPVADAPLYALVELASNHDPLDELASAFELAGIDDAAIADDTASRQQLWRLREGITDAIAAEGVPHKIDVGVPPAALPMLLERLERVVHEAASDAQTVVFGHLGDGNLHVA